MEGHVRHGSVKLAFWDTQVVQGLTVNFPENAAQGFRGFGVRTTFAGGSVPHQLVKLFV